MLQRLSIQNYALIEHLELDLPAGLTILTGETGAGKSILLGALGLVLGQRADLNALREPEKKCIIEGHFTIPANLQPLFEQEMWDYQSSSIIRREIWPSGKSRAFINDSPTTLQSLQKLSSRLIDVHSQHQALLLHNREFQLELLDSFAQNQPEKKAYQQAYRQWLALKKEYQALPGESGQPTGDRDYLQFLWEELEAAQLKKGEAAELEQTWQFLEHAGDIQNQLGVAQQLLEHTEGGILSDLREATQRVEQARRYREGLAPFAERLQSARIELEDLQQELEQEQLQLEYDPRQHEHVQQRLSLLHQLTQKHQLPDADALLEHKEQLARQIEQLDQQEDRRAELARRREKQEKKAIQAAQRLHDTRARVAPELAKEVQALLQELHMSDASFSIEIKAGEQLSLLGLDDIYFWFSANAGMSARLLHKIASGGELSRVTLALKAIMARSRGLPSIIFDEIDSGVSGGTAGKIGDILQEMSRYMQVVAITHLPQIAAQGARHYKVVKEKEGDHTHSRLQKLEERNRLAEIARLLSGETITEAALANAEALLKGH